MGAQDGHACTPPLPWSSAAGEISCLRLTRVPGAHHWGFTLDKWPELLVAAVSTVGALLGVGLGAWWQGRSSLRLLREQTRDAWSTRGHQVRHEQTMKLFDDKRAAYVRLSALVDELHAAMDDLQADRRMPAGLAGVEDPGPEPELRATKVADDVDALLTLIEILAPKQVYEAAVFLSVASLNHSPRLTPAMTDFVNFIRYDLGTDGSPPSGWTPTTP